MPSSAQLYYAILCCSVVFCLMSLKFGYHRQVEGEGAWMTKYWILPLWLTIHSPLFMWTVASLLSVFAQIQYCLGWSSNNISWLRLRMALEKMDWQRLTFLWRNYSGSKVTRRWFTINSPRHFEIRRAKVMVHYGHDWNGESKKYVFKILGQRAEALL